MERQSEYPRTDWQQIVEQQGLIFHHTDAGAYWDESASYRLTAAQVDELEKATNEPASYGYMRRVLVDLKARGIVESLGNGRGYRSRRHTE